MGAAAVIINTITDNQIEADLRQQEQDAQFSRDFSEQNKKKQQEAEQRKSSDQIRREWEKKNGKPWPIDKKTGNKQDVQHKRAKADGGSDNQRNIKPMPRDKHMEHHKQRGDFVRWGKRAKKKGEGD